MATKNVLVIFRIQDFDGTKTLEFNHALPSSLCTSVSSNQRSVISTIQRICAQHYAAVLAINRIPCVECDAPCTSMVHGPMSYLHLPQPKIIVQTAPVCGTECESLARSHLHEMMASITGAPIVEAEQCATAPPMRQSSDSASCEHCGEIRGIKKCARCMVAAYCGRECQKAAWKVHKRDCLRNRNVGSVEA